MQSTVFEHLLSCRNCNSAVLIQDPSASHSMIGEAGAVGLVIRHETREVIGGISLLDIFPFTARHPLSSSPHADVEDQKISRQSICMENCATPEGRRKISKEWGLQWWGFEQHFETIATWAGTHVGQCPCECHNWHVVEDATCEDAGCVDDEAIFEGDDCASFKSTAPLVSGQESVRCPVEPGGRVAGRDDDRPPGLPEEGRDRARSEEIRHTDQWILEWREQCRREQGRRDTFH